MAEPVQYPKVKYHKTEAPRTVKNEEEESHLEGDWHNSPADVHKLKPETSKIILSDVPQKNGDSETEIETVPEEDEGADDIKPKTVETVSDEGEGAYDSVTIEPKPAIKPKAGRAK
jgi:hypothetical protein